jgi:hypothetical protein
MKFTLKLGPTPSHWPVAYDPCFVQGSNESSQTGKRQSSRRGSQPKSALASELFPTPVAPMMMTVGSEPAFLSDTYAATVDTRKAQTIKEKRVIFISEGKIHPYCLEEVGAPTKEKYYENICSFN